MSDSSPAVAAPLDAGQTAAPAIDGRHQRSFRTRDVLLAACRQMMAHGEFRPTMEDVAEAAEVSTRQAFTHFGTIQALHVEAAADLETERRVIDLILDGRHWPDYEPRRRLIKAIVVGKL